MSFTHRRLFGEGLQVQGPLEDTKQQAVIAILQPTTLTRIPRCAALARGYNLGRMSFYLSMKRL